MYMLIDLISPSAHNLINLFKARIICHVYVQVWSGTGIQKLLIVLKLLAIWHVSFLLDLLFEC